jgi:hypothetical protein
MVAVAAVVGVEGVEEAVEVEAELEVETRSRASRAARR